MNEKNTNPLEAIQAARLERRRERNEQYSNALPRTIANLEKAFLDIEEPSKADKRRLEADKLAEGMKAIEILRNAILRKIEIQRNMNFSSHDRNDAAQAALMAATEQGFFETMQTSAELYAALSRAIYNGLGINKTWELAASHETLEEISDAIEDVAENNVYLTLKADSVLPVLEAAFSSDTRKRRKAIFKAKVKFLEGCLSYAQGGAADIISRSGFRTAKQEFLEYIEKGILQMKLTSLEDYWQKA